MKKILIGILVVLLGFFCLSNCGSKIAPEDVTIEDLDKALSEYNQSNDEDDLEVFEIVGKEKTCQYFMDHISEHISLKNYEPLSTSVEIDEYKEVYDLLFTEKNDTLEKMVALNFELKQARREREEINNKYPFTFSSAVNGFQVADFYISYRIEMAYEDNLLGKLQEEIESYIPGEDSYWRGSNVLYDYWMGYYGGDDTYVLYATTLNPFQESGVYTVMYYSDGDMLTMTDGSGFQKEVPLLYLIDSNDYEEYIAADAEIYNVMLELNFLCDENFAGDEVENSIAAEDYIGEWVDANSHRYSLDITKETDEIYNFTIHWMSGGIKNTTWIGSAEFDEKSGALSYTVLCINETILDDGTISEEVVYDGGTGEFMISPEGNLYWSDFVENTGANCVFEKIE